LEAKKAPKKISMSVSGRGSGEKKCAFRAYLNGGGFYRRRSQKTLPGMTRKSSRGEWITA